MNDTKKLITGIFIKECASRFLCEVMVNNQKQLCYISNSSKLTPIYHLNNKEVLLIKNSGKRTIYTLHAIRNKNSYILLNVGLVNQLIFENILKKKFYNHQILKETSVSKSYKADFITKEKEEHIIEVKSILSDNAKAVFPSVLPERGLRQLEEIKRLLNKGKKVNYYLVLLNPNIKALELNNKFCKFKELFNACIKLGMTVSVFRVAGTPNKITLKRCSLLEGKLKKIK